MLDRTLWQLPLHDHFKKNLSPTFSLPNPPNYDMIESLSVNKADRPISKSPLSSRSQKSRSQKNKI
ncbi:MULTISPECIES: hypothetical protein [unclassified Microcoleus]|uniref:hypothetical protein n=1 Tax=unclassified Microcoleus TaxID=2642155 RepID=UPI002FD26405